MNIHECVEMRISDWQSGGEKERKKKREREEEEWMKNATRFFMNF